MNYMALNISKYTDVQYKIFGEIGRILEELGADMSTLCAIGSIGDTLEDTDILSQLETVKNGVMTGCVSYCESDNFILKEVEQKVKRKITKPPEK
jgi:hypothetical protein